MTFRFWDRDGDGIKTADEIFYVLKMAFYLGLATYCVIVEGLTPEDRFSDFEFISIVTASFGASMYEAFLRLKFGKQNGD